MFDDQQLNWDGALHSSTIIEGCAFGGPDVLSVNTGPIGAPQPEEVLINQVAIGVNFIDILLRRGELSKQAPYRVGLEASGHVLALGEKVVDLAVGDRVVYAGGPPGAYATLRCVPASRVVKLPASIDLVEAAGVFFKALTADYLVNRLRKLEPRDAVLVHAAAGGIGSLAIPLLKAAGVTVLGVVGANAKRQKATDLGCDHVIVQDEVTDIAEEVRRFTGGAGVSVAYDSVGRDTFEASMRSLQRFGLLVSYGWASGEVAPVSLAKLRDCGSLFLTRPTISHYTERRDDLLAGAGRAFRALESGVLKAQIGLQLSIRQAAQAHEAMEQRRTQGSVVLLA